MLSLNNINFCYPDKQILSYFSLKVSDGECVLLKGPSGCGKTTVVKILAKILTPSSGEIFSPQKISIVFQEDRLLDNLSLNKNLKSFLNKNQIKFADTLLEKVGLKEFKNSPVKELSGGMKRRLSIVIAVAFCGDALILDEAFNGLDLKNKKICAEIIKENFLDKKKPVLLISHFDSDAELFGAKIIKQ